MGHGYKEIREPAVDSGHPLTEFYVQSDNHTGGKSLTKAGTGEYKLRGT
jgi:hypothetical protein